MYYFLSNNLLHSNPPKNRLINVAIRVIGIATSLGNLTCPLDEMFFKYSLAVFERIRSCKSFQAFAIRLII